MKDYYKILGLGETATNEQIKKAFKDIAKKEHPDKGGNLDRFQEASEAHDTLKDSQKRHDYDTQRKLGSGQGQHPFFNEDVFGDFFSGFQQGRGGDMDFNSRFNFTQGNQGKHWVALVLREDICYYFDSFRLGIMDKNLKYQK